MENTDDMEGLIEAIIKANQNLTQSNTNNDWEMMGKDVKHLQDLITSLETMKEQEDKKKEELNKTTNSINDTNLIMENENRSH